MSLVDQHFEILGFSSKEKHTYLTLAEAGKATASQISKRTKIPRATVYTHLEALIEKGVVTQEHSKAGSLYAIKDVSAFLTIVDHEKEKLVQKQRSAEELVDLLSPYLKSSQYSVPKLQFFEGKSRINNMLYEYLPKWRESMQRTNNTLWGFQDPTVVSEYRKWHLHLWKTKSESESIRLFSNQSERREQINVAGREVRVLPEGVHFSSSIWLYGEYIIMIMTSQRPHYAFQIKDSVFASNHRAIFQLLWKARF